MAGGMSEDEAKSKHQFCSKRKPCSTAGNKARPKWSRLWRTMNNWVYDGFGKTYTEMGVDFDKLYYESNTYLLGKDQVAAGLEAGVFFKKDDGGIWIDLSDEGLDEKLLLRKDGTAVYMTQDIGTAILRYNDFPGLERQVYTVGNEQEYHFKVLFTIFEEARRRWCRKNHHTRLWDG